MAKDPKDTPNALTSPPDPHHRRKETYPDTAARLKETREDHAAQRRQETITGMVGAILAGFADRKKAWPTNARAELSVTIPGGIAKDKPLTGKELISIERSIVENMNRHLGDAAGDDSVTVELGNGVLTVKADNGVVRDFQARCPAGVVKHQ